MSARSLSHRVPLLGLTVAWIVGASLVHTGVCTLSPVLAGAFALGALALAWLALPLEARQPRLARPLSSAALLLALAAVGALHTHTQRAHLPEWDALALPPREARLELRLERPFAVREPGRAAGLARVLAADPALSELVGQRISYSIDWPAPDTATTHTATLRGTELTTRGLLRPLSFRPPAGTFDRFLADEGINFSLERGRLVGAPLPPRGWLGVCAKAGTRLEEILRHGLERHPALADLYVAMLLGRKQSLDAQQKDWFVRSGTMHLFAVSGLHIAAIALALNTLLTLARVPAAARFVAGTPVLWLYVQITGGDPSAVRAFWMVTCLLAAHRLRAPSNSLSALFASALGVLLVAPHQLFSAGFQLSYGIVAALLLYGVPLQERWHAAWQPWVHLPRTARGWPRRAAEELGRFVLAALALGLAATLFSTPATLGFFGLLAPVGFFINLLLIPLASLVLFSGVTALLCGLIGLDPLASLFNHAAALLLAAMEHSVRIALELPGASWPAHFQPAWLATAGCSGLLVLLAVGYSFRWSPRLGGYWTPYAALALLLAFGAHATLLAP